MSYHLLKRDGIHLLEHIRGISWTDHNAHDPGITILEQLCYALTDLTYRIDFEMSDLIKGDGAASQAFYTPSTLLQTRPVTVRDLRKLLIDVNGIRNAWLETDDESSSRTADFHYNARDGVLKLSSSRLSDDPVNLRGLYRVRLEFEEGLNPNERKNATKTAILRLHANRPLCEDFSQIDELVEQKIEVQTHIEIETVDDPEALLLAIYNQIGQEISPSVTFRPLSQLLAEGKAVDEIFDGPQLDHGFIDDDELDKVQRRTHLRTSDLIRAIMDVAGVKAVRYIEIPNSGKAEQPEADAGTQFQIWSLPLDEDKAPRFDDAQSDIVLLRNGLRVEVNRTNVLNRYRNDINARVFRDALPAAERDFAIPQGRNRHVGEYHSIQHQFPANYGIGALGLPASATPQRRAQAKQLQAYLLLFEQLLANSFAQLAHINELFSFSSDARESYFSQAIDDPSLGLGDIRNGEGDSQSLDADTDDEQLNHEQRRNRFLNHLLARFAEQFTDYGLLSSDPNKLIGDKQRFLQNYPELSRSRGTASNYLEEGGAQNRSGLEEAIRLKLGIEDPREDFILIENISLRPMAGDKSQTVPLLSDTNHPDPYSLRLTFVFPLNSLNNEGSYADENFRTLVERTVRQESPAHLSIDLQWVEEERMKLIRQAYKGWLEQRRLYWREVFLNEEVQPDDFN